MALLLLTAGAATLWPAAAALADEPAGTAQVTLEPIPPPNRAPGQDSVILSARAHDSGGRPLGGLPLTFYVMTDVFGDRLMNVGEALTDASGVAALAYEVRWVGEHTVVLRYPGDENFAPSQTTFEFSAAGPVPHHENAAFGLEPVRAWLPLAVGSVVLIVWAVLGFVVFRVVTGIPAAAAPVSPPVGAPEPLVPRPMRFGLVFLAVAVLVAAPVAWTMVRDSGGDEVSLSASGGAGGGQGHGAGPPGTDVPSTAEQTPMPADLLESIPVIKTDSQGNITRDSADLPADLARIEGRVFILDTNNGRILTLSPAGDYAPILESERSGLTSFWGATAMTAHDDLLYIANSAVGNVLVVSTSGHIEAVIKPQAPEGDQPLKPAGIAVTDSGDIWLSDPDNHRVLSLDSRGGLIGVIGEGAPSSGDYGFSSPGGLARDDQGNLLVADTLNHLVKRYSPIGTFIQAIGEGYLAEPQALSVDQDGNIFVSDGRLSSVLGFAPDGSYLGSVGLDAAAGRSIFQAPRGLVAEGDSLYVLDRLAGLFVYRLESAGAP